MNKPYEILVRNVPLKYKAKLQAIKDKTGLPIGAIVRGMIEAYFKKGGKK